MKEHTKKLTVKIVIRMSTTADEENHRSVDEKSESTVSVDLTCKTTVYNELPEMFRPMDQLTRIKQASK